MLQELCDLLRWKLDQVDFIDTPVSLPYDCPLDVHCSYTRDTRSSLGGIPAK